MMKMKNISVAAMALAIAGHGDGAEHGEQEDPEENRAVEPAPVRRDLVGQRHRAVRVALDVLDRVVAGDEGVDDDAGRDGHQRGGHVEGADAAFDQRARPAPSAGDRRGQRVAGDHEGGEQDERAEGRHASCPP
jgi:hypothetical protein